MSLAPCELSWTGKIKVHMDIKTKTKKAFCASSFVHSFCFGIALRCFVLLYRISSYNIPGSSLCSNWCCCCGVQSFTLPQLLFFAVISFGWSRCNINDFPIFLPVFIFAVWLRLRTSIRFVLLPALSVPNCHNNPVFHTIYL